MKSAIGIDLGATNARVGLVTFDGNIKYKTKSSIANDRSVDNVLSVLENAIKDCQNKSDNNGYDLSGIGIGIAAQTDKTGKVIISPNLSWKNIPLKSLLQNKLEDVLSKKMTLIIQNDLNVAAWGEVMFGSAKGYDDVVCIFAGSGIGAGLIVNGKLVTGGNNLAGEIGHVKVVLNEGLTCGCNEIGCMEAYAGGVNLQNQASMLLNKDKTKILYQLTKGLKSNITGTLLEQAALSDDKICKKLHNKATEYLGLSIANTITVLNPEVLVLGGGMFTGCPIYKEKTIKNIHKFASKSSMLNLKITDA